MADTAPSGQADDTLDAARAALKAGDAVEADRLVSMCLAVAPTDVPALRLRLDLQRRRGDLDAATEAAARLDAVGDRQLSFLDRRLIDCFLGRPLGPAPPLPDLPAGFRLVDDFLPAEDHAAVRAYCLGRDDTPPVPGEDRSFHPATVVRKDAEDAPDGSKSGGTDVRQAWVMGRPAARITDTVVERVRALVPEIAGALGIGGGRPGTPTGPFHPGEIEVQITAHGHGAFYKPHQDGSLDPTSPIHRRQVSFVYYVHGATPDGRPPFGGGDLRLFDTTLPSGLFDADRFTRIAPRDNRLILFDSLFVHEVCPVDLPDNDPQHRRLTVNGWVHPATG